MGFHPKDLKPCLLSDSLEGVDKKETEWVLFEVRQ